MKGLLLLLIKIYQWFISPLLAPACRFEPSCSRYAAGCIEQHGALRGGLLSVKRLCKCHPFHPGGHDPVPPSLSSPAKSLPPPRSHLTHVESLDNGELNTTSATLS